MAQARPWADQRAYTHKTTHAQDFVNEVAEPGAPSQFVRASVCENKAPRSTSGTFRGAATYRVRSKTFARLSQHIVKRQRPDYTDSVTIF